MPFPEEEEDDDDDDGDTKVNPVEEATTEEIIRGVDKEGTGWR